jgi:hypothetical protein
MLYMICMTGSTGASVPHDADNCCFTVYPVPLLLYYCWCMLYTTCSMFRAWPVYISLLYHAQIMQLLNHVLLTLNKSSILSNTLKSFKTYSLQKTEQFQHDMFSNNLHNLNLNRKTYSNTLNQLTPFTHASILKHHW